MMNFKKNAVIIVVLGALATVLPGCKKEEGPAERAGKAVDNAVQKAGKEIEKAGENIQKAAEDAKK